MESFSLTEGVWKNVTLHYASFGMQPFCKDASDYENICISAIMIAVSSFPYHLFILNGFMTVHFIQSNLMLLSA